MNTFLWIILVFVSIYYGFIIFVRYVLPWLLTRFVKKQQEKFNNFGNKQPDQDEVKVKTKRKKSNKDDGSFGEYVDFEEIDDK